MANTGSEVRQHNTTGIYCRDMSCDAAHQEDIDTLSSHIVNIRLEAAECSTPSKHKHKTSTVSGWSDQVECYYRNDALFWHAIRKQCSSPQQDPVPDIRRRTRFLYEPCRNAKRQKSVTKATVWLQH